MKILHVLSTPRAEGTPNLVLDWLAPGGHEKEVFVLYSTPGFRFDHAATCVGIADAVEAGLADKNRFDALRRWSPLLTWERCVRQIEEWRVTGAVRHPVELWKAWPVS
jgi:hypothetical protein